VALVGIDVSEERLTPIIRVESIRKLVTAKAVPSSLSVHLYDEGDTFSRNVGSNKNHRPHASDDDILLNKQA
jgi:hypothetical protein